MSPTPPNLREREKELIAQYLKLVDSANAAIDSGDSNARVAAEQEVSKIGSQLDDIRSQKA